MSTQMHPAVLGTYFLVSFPFATFLFFSARNFRERILGGITGVAGFLGVFLAFSQSAFWGIFIFLTLYLLKKNRKSYLTLMGILLIFFIFVGPLSKSFPFLGRFNPRFNKILYQNQLRYRLDRFSMTFKILERHPLTGAGINNFRSLFEKYQLKKDFPWEYKFFERYYLKKQVSEDVPYEFKIPDNMYLSLFAETGIIGLFCFLLFIFGLFKKAFRTIKMVSHEEKDFLLILLSGFVGILVNMASYDLFYWYMPLYFFWIYAGCIRGLSSKPVP